MPGPGGVSQEALMEDIADVVMAYLRGSAHMWCELRPAEAGQADMPKNPE